MFFFLCKILFLFCFAFLSDASVSTANMTVVLFKYKNGLICLVFLFAGVEHLERTKIICLCQE